MSARGRSPGAARGRRAGTGGILLAFMAIRCAATDVVIADLPDDAGSALEAACIGFDCPPSPACAELDCEASDSCEPRPDSCGDEHDPVCGCDGITYWNDCLRRQSGVPHSGWDPCRRSAKTCEIDEDCGPHGSCAHLIPLSGWCGQSRPGTCWVLPPSCPSRQSAEWVSCDPLDPVCVPTCEAIDSNERYRRADTYDRCP